MLERILSVLNEFPELGEITNLRSAGSGFSSDAYLINTGGYGSCIVKVGKPGSNTQKWRAAENGVRLAKQAGVRVPKPLIFEEFCEHLDGRILRVATYLEGRILTGSKATAGFWRELGKSIRKLHNISWNGFSSRLIDAAPTYDNWSEYLDYRVPQILGRLEKSAALDFATSMHLLQLAQELSVTLDFVVEPRLVHRDLHGDNIIIGKDGGLGGIIDFDCIEPWDPVCEWVKLNIWLFAGNLQNRLYFEEGYGKPNETWAHFDKRYAIAVLIEVINMFSNLRKEADSWADAPYAELERICKKQGWPVPQRIRS